MRLGVFSPCPYQKPEPADVTLRIGQQSCVPAPIGDCTCWKDPCRRLELALLPKAIARAQRVHIITMPRQLIIIGMPICTMLHLALQHFMNMSIIAPSRASFSRSFRSASWCISCGSPIGTSGIDIIGFHHPRIIMGIGIICIAGFMVGLRSKSEKKLHVSYSRDKMHRCERQ